MGKEMRDMIKKENKLCFQHRMERKTEKSFQLSAGRQRLLASEGFLAPPARLPSPENSAWKCTERLPFKLEGKKYHRTSYVSADTGAASVPRGMDCVSGR